MNAPNPYAPPKSQVADIHSQDEAPPLWNPNAAANWSLLFSPVFGALVQMKNWQALGEDERAATSKMWAIGSAITIGIFTLLSIVSAVLTSSPDIGRSVGLILLVVWYFANGRAQSKYVKEQFGTDYPRRGWGKPLLVAVGVLLGFLAAAMIVGVIVGVASRT
jgi:uncharacterized membrane-anchored protein